MIFKMGGVNHTSRIKKNKKNKYNLHLVTVTKANNYN